MPSRPFLSYGPTITSINVRHLYYTLQILTPSEQFPWPAEVTGVERIALSAQGGLQRVLRFIALILH